MSAMAIDPNLFATARPPGLGRNPSLPQHPLGAYTDATYEAAQAELARQTQQQYNDVLQQLGYTDEQGNFVMGDVETEAARQHAQLGRDEDLARRDVTNQMQQQGTLFSGYRGLQEARQTEPMETQRGQLMVDTPKALARLYQQAAGIVGDYTIGQNKLIADAATRRAQQLATDPGGGGGGGGTGTPDPTVVPPPGGNPTGGAGGGTPSGLPATPATSWGPTTYDVGGNAYSGTNPPPAAAGPLPNQGTYIVGGQQVTTPHPAAVAAPPPVAPPLPNQGSYIVGGQTVQVPPPAPVVAPPTIHLPMQGVAHAGPYIGTMTPQPTPVVNHEAIANAAAKASRQRYYGGF